MVGFDLHAKGQAEEGSAKYGVIVTPSAASVSHITIRINKCCQHPRHKGYCLHFGIVAYLDYLEIVTAEGHGYCAANGHRPAYAQGQEQQERTKQSDKQICGRALACKQRIINPLRQISLSRS